VQEDPQRFDQLKSVYCCDGIEQASAGQGLPVVEAALQELAVGAIASRAIEVMPGDLRLVRRVQPRPEAPVRAIHASLPSRTAPDLTFLLRHATNGPALAGYVLALHERVARATAVSLSVPDASGLRDIIIALAARLRELGPEQRMGAVDEAMLAIQEQFGSSLATRYRASMMSELARDLL
jgi:hypothetical protein